MAFGRDDKPQGVIYPEEFRSASGAPRREAGGFIASLARESDPQWQLARALVEGSNDPQLITDAAMNVALANPPLASLIGRAPHEMAGRSIMEFVQVEADGLFGPETEEHLDGLGKWEGRGVVLCQDGREAAVQLDLRAVRGEHDIVNYYVLFARPVESEDRERVQRNPVALDTTTGLPRWNLLRSILRRKLKDAAENDTVLAVLVLELRNIRRVSQTHGHEMGRRIRAMSARRIQPLVGGTSMLSRLSGDTFGIVIDRLASPEEAVETARQLLEALRPPFDLRGQEVFIKADVGLAVYPQHGVGAEELLRNAEVALEHARRKDSGGFRIYSDEMHRDACRRAEMESHLHYALERNELLLYYQPQVHPHTNTIVGAEVLLRWQHPEWGLVSPDSFIPIAEETGLIVDIGAWLLRVACRQYESWLMQGLRLPKLSVNVSGQQIRAGNLLPTVREILRDVDLYGGRLELELTESIIMDDAPETLAAMEELRKLGVQTSIDDFGTGYSSLTYLREFPTDALKIDRSFVMGLPDEHDSEVIVRMIVQMAATLGLATIAEGVETREQLRYVQQQGVSAVQGFIFSRPVPAREFSQMLKLGRIGLKA